MNVCFFVVYKKRQIYHINLHKVVREIKVETYAVRLDKNFNESKFHKLIKHTMSEKSRIKKFCSYECAQSTLIGCILIRYLLCKKLNIRNSELKFKKNDYGKPSLSMIDNMHYNISHSREWVVCAINNLPVGIDVEYINSTDLKIAERFFSRIEYNDLMSKKEEERKLYFYELWTLKESYIKAIGKGLSIKLDSFYFRSNNGNITMTNTDEYNNTDDFYFKQYDLDKEYKLAVCACKNSFSENIRIIKIDELYESVNYSNIS